MTGGVSTAAVYKAEDSAPNQAAGASRRLHGNDARFQAAMVGKADVLRALGSLAGGMILTFRIGNSGGTNPGIVNTAVS